MGLSYLTNYLLDWKWPSNHLENMQWLLPSLSQAHKGMYILNTEKDLEAN